jgi:hypothetical protein
MKRLAAAALVLAGAASAAPPAKLDMLAFFNGRTHAENVMKIALKRPAKLIVDSLGGRNKEGEFVLIDTVREEGKPVRERRWVMHPVGPDRFTGSLSDAVGPVSVAINGRTATIRYTMKGGLKVDQRLELQGDGKTLSNQVVVKKFGLRFAHVDGTVRKLD